MEKIRVRSKNYFCSSFYEMWLIYRQFLLCVSQVRVLWFGVYCIFCCVTFYYQFHELKILLDWLFAPIQTFHFLLDLLIFLLRFRQKALVGVQNINNFAMIGCWSWHIAEVHWKFTLELLILSINEFLRKFQCR